MLKFVAISELNIKADPQHRLYIQPHWAINRGQKVLVQYFDETESTWPDGRPEEKLVIRGLNKAAGRRTGVDPVFRLGKFKAPSSLEKSSKIIQPFIRWQVMVYLPGGYSPIKIHNLLKENPINAAQVFSAFDDVIFEMYKNSGLSEEAEALYEKASKCKARFLGTPYEGEAQTAFQKAVEILFKIIKG